MSFEAGIDLSNVPIRKMLLRIKSYDKARRERAEFQAAVAGAKLKK